MTRLGSGKLKLERDWIGVDELLGSAVARLRKRYPDAARRDLDSPPDLPPLYVHPALVEQALFNVLENAAKFSPPGEPVAVAAARRAATSCVIDVSDRGPGIPEDERERIFDMFYSVDAAIAAAQGTGLGLDHRARA